MSLRLNHLRPALKMAVHCWKELIDAGSPLAPTLQEYVDMAESSEDYEEDSDEENLLVIQAEIFQALSVQAAAHDQKIAGLIWESINHSINTILADTTSLAVCELEEALIASANARPHIQTTVLHEQIKQLEAELAALKAQAANNAS